jgi:hypothetical protein
LFAFSFGFYQFDHQASQNRPNFNCFSLLSHQELRCKEEELSRMQQQQKREQENLMKLAQELKNRELDLLTRELQIVMNNAPTPVKRRGKIGTSRFRVSVPFLPVTCHLNLLSHQFLKKAPGQISFPLDFKHKITVKTTGSVDEANLQADTPPGSPAIKPRLRAIARKSSSPHPPPLS